uniref:CD80-like immunoglobulin C2-set domain-containing protein n=1 Tax=Stomoxys calcitrans TaxID=35570 RepID=A0A1I8PZZ0_STOCA
RSQSNESQLVLESINSAATGKYSCEVSADAPSFHTLIGAGEMEVVVVPIKDPIISSIRSRYKVGDIIRGNCTSGHSRPGANITWNINGYEINPVHVKHYNSVKDAREMELVTSGIHFVVTPQHFIYGKLKIRCTAHIHDVYWKSTEKSVEENRHTKSSGNVNMVQTFSEDYFDMEDENVIDRSDTYMTHIKGDVSSLNASGGSSTLHACLSCFWPRLTALSLLLFHGVQQLLQLYFFGRETIKDKISNCLAFNGKITPANNGNCKGNNNDDNKNAPQKQQEQKQSNKTKVFHCPVQRQQNLEMRQDKQQQLQLKTEHVQPKDQRRILSAPISTEVAAICYKTQTNEMLSLRETFLQIKLINNKRAQMQQQHPPQHHQQQDDCVLKVEHHLNRQLPGYEQHQLKGYQQHQVPCDKTVYENYNLTMTIQVANIFNVAAGAITTATATAAATSNIKANVSCSHALAGTTEPLAVVVAAVISSLWPQQSVAINHNLYQVQQQNCYTPTKRTENTYPPLATSNRILSTSNGFFRIMSEASFIAMAKTIAIPSTAAAVATIPTSALEAQMAAASATT